MKGHTIGENGAPLVWSSVWESWCKFICKLLMTDFFNYLFKRFVILKQENVLWLTVCIIHLFYRLEEMKWKCMFVPRPCGGDGSQLFKEGGCQYSYVANPWQTAQTTATKGFPSRPVLGSPVEVTAVHRIHFHICFWLVINTAVYRRECPYRGAAVSARRRGFGSKCLCKTHLPMVLIIQRDKVTREEIFRWTDRQAVSTAGRQMESTTAKCPLACGKSNKSQIFILTGRKTYDNGRDRN